MDRHMASLDNALAELTAVHKAHDEALKNAVRDAGLELRPICDISKLLALQEIMDKVCEL